MMNGRFDGVAGISFRWQVKSRRRLCILIRAGDGVMTTGLGRNGMGTLDGEAGIVGMLEPDESGSLDALKDTLLSIWKRTFISPQDRPHQRFDQRLATKVAENQGKQPHTLRPSAEESARSAWSRNYFPLDPLHGATADADQLRHLQHTVSGI